MAAIIHAAERKAFEVALGSVMKKADKNRSEGYVEIVNMIEKVLKDGWKPEAYERLRTVLGKDGKWTHYFNKSRKSPASIVKGNKQWVGTCLYQEGYKPLLINCEAVIWL